MDLLADKFGLHFNNVLVHHVIDDNFAMGRIDLTPFRRPSNPHVLYMKDTCSLTLSGTGQFRRCGTSGDLLMALAEYGKGMVFAVTDPWLYNEYTDGRKLPADYDNFAAGKELVQLADADQRRAPSAVRERQPARTEPAAR